MKDRPADHQVLKPLDREVKASVAQVGFLLPGIPGVAAAAMHGATAAVAGAAAAVCLCVRITTCSACLWCQTPLATLAGHSSSALMQLNQANVCLHGLMNMKEVCCIACLS